MAIDFPSGVPDGYEYSYTDPQGTTTVYIWIASSGVWYPTISGKAGPQGPKGEKGIEGKGGTDGAKGEVGTKGDKGPLGEKGPAGVKGGRGEKGIEGQPSTEPGPKGPEGPKGNRGQDGLPSMQEGPEGPAGPKGERGAGGNPSYAEGPKGNKGNRGQQGDPGSSSGFTATKHSNGSSTSPGIYPTGDTGCGFFRNAAGNYGIVTSNTYRGKFSGLDFTYRGVKESTYGPGVDVGVDNNGRLRAKSSTRRSKSNIRTVKDIEAKLFLEKAVPVKYNVFVPDPEWPAAYLQDIIDNPDDHEGTKPTIDGCEVWCKSNNYTEWSREGKDINEGADPNDQMYGFIAEDLGKEFPEFGAFNAEYGDYDYVHYGNITAILTSICQMQEKRIEALEARVNSMGETK
jgi:hypothetical protein